MTNADFCLDIARRELKRLRACAGPVRLGSSGHSAHFRHAVICSVFSAFAVEHVLTELIWVRCFFQTPEPHRRVALQHASGLRTISGKLGFIQAATKIPAHILADMKRLFEYRNQIAHCRVLPFEGSGLDFESVQEIVEQGRGPELDKAMELALRGMPEALRTLADEFGEDASELQLGALGTGDIDAAAANLEIAERAVKALRREMESVEWPLVRPNQTSRA